MMHKHSFRTSCNFNANKQAVMPAYWSAITFDGRNSEQPLGVPRT